MDKYWRFYIRRAFNGLGDGGFDAEEAYEKAAEWLDRKREKKDDRKYMLEYYRYLGMASAEKEGKRSFLVILLR